VLYLIVTKNPAPERPLGPCESIRNNTALRQKTEK
jgi:hypothetical protein